MEYRDPVHSKVKVCVLTTKATTDLKLVGGIIAHPHAGLGAATYDTADAGRAEIKPKYAGTHGMI